VLQKSAFSVDEFCGRNSISRAFHYKLQKAGKGVRIRYVNNKPIVTADDEREWLQSLATEPAKPRKARTPEAQSNQ
jgi:hypothetical protein